jgi:hypothetical protein
MLAPSRGRGLQLMIDVDRAELDAGDVLDAAQRFQKNGGIKAAAIRNTKLRCFGRQKASQGAEQVLWGEGWHDTSR